MSANNVVVIGGGCAGIVIANKLEATLPSNFRVVLIERRPFYYHTIAALRSAVEDLSIMLPYDKLFKKNGVFVQGEVVSISAQAVTLAAAHAQFGETIPYSYLVIATGSSWSSPFLTSSIDANEATAILARSRENISNATSILIVGGGSCGLELAAEIKEQYPKKQVTVVHSQPLVLNARYPAKFIKNTHNRIAKMGVEFILDDKVEILPEQATTVNARTFVTQKGKEINADFVVYTVGGRPNVAIMNTFDASLIIPAGIRVKNTLQLDHQSITNIFVAGDAAGFDECKTAYKAAHSHAPIVIHNIMTLIKGKGKLKTYKAPTAEDTIIVTAGKRGGTSLLMGMNMGDFPTRKLKSEGLFIKERMKDLGY